MCQAAVEAVLKGAPVIHIPSETTAEPTNPIPMPLLKAFDIRHVSRDQTTQPFDLHKVANSTRTRFKRSAKRNVNNDDNSSDRRWMDQIHIHAPDVWENKTTAIYSVQPIHANTDGEDSKEDNVKLELTIGRSSPSSPNDTDPTNNVSHPTTVARRIELSMSDYKRLWQTAGTFLLKFVLCD